MCLSLQCSESARRHKQPLRYHFESWRDVGPRPGTGSESGKGAELTRMFSVEYGRGFVALWHLIEVFRVLEEFCGVPRSFFGGKPSRQLTS